MYIRFYNIFHLPGMHIKVRLGTSFLDFIFLIGLPFRIWRFLRNNIYLQDNHPPGFISTNLWGQVFLTSSTRCKSASAWLRTGWWSILPHLCEPSRICNCCFYISTFRFTVWVFFSNMFMTEILTSAICHVRIVHSYEH